MRQNLCLFLLILICHTPSIAQKIVPEFGKINATDLSLKSCSFEPEAAAMKLFDVQEIEFDPYGYDTRLKTERRVRIKLFKEAGYKYASIKIPYFSKRGVTKMKDLKGCVYNLDPSGNVVVQKLEKQDFFKNQLSDNVGVINFTFPNLKPGSVVEFSYTKIEKNISQIDAWVVQDEIPVAYAATILTTPSIAKIKEKFYGTDTLPQTMEKISGDRERRIYFKEEVASFQNEPMMSSLKDNLLRVMFLMIPKNNFFLNLVTESDKIWRFAGATLLSSSFFGGQIKKPIPGTQALIDSAKKINTVEGRIKFLYNAVKKRCPHKPEQTSQVGDIADAWNNLDGNSAEVNLILLNLFDKVNVQAYPLLISTRNNGKINTEFPSVGQFNGVDVLAVDSNRVYFLDASLKKQSYLNPPANVLNRKAFLLDKNDMKWILIDDSRMLIKSDINVGANLQDECIEGIANLRFYDYAKSQFLDSTESDEGAEEQSAKRIQGLQILSEKIEQDDDEDKPLKQQLSFTYHPQKTDNFYFINPQFLFRKKKNPFTNEKRNTDIDFGSNQESNFKLLLRIPPEYKVEYVPKSTIVRAPDSSFFYKRVCTVDSTGIFFQQTFEIKHSVFYKEDYDAIKEFFKRIFTLMSEEIILKRK